MKLTVTTPIDAPREAIWQTITDIEHAAERISGIEELEVLERPASGLVGLKWKETRTMFGKTATEVMWITDAVEGRSYDVRAESHGMIYRSRLSIDEGERGAELTMSFSGEATSLFGRIMGAIMGPLFKGATEKALRQDLADIRAAAEARGATRDAG